MSRAASQPPALRGFEFVRLLGSGGFSDVYLFDQELPRRRVAVKVLLTDALTDQNRAAFVAEANVMAQLSAHPYIVSIHHADVADDGRPYFIMEYCSGPSLAARYKSQPLGVVEALQIGIRVSSAVATAHQAGILHRDIKPANILINDYGWPALTDFGISSAFEEEVATHTVTRGGDSEAHATTGSQSVGMSIPWSPPEMFDDEPRPDVRADVFSLAATVHTLLAGRTPFELPGRSNGTMDLISRIERGQITPIERTDIPASLLAVLRKGMATSRSDRYASAVEFARALQRVELELQYSPTAIDVPNLVVPAPQRDADPEAEDATRARGVTAIQAQAPVAAPEERSPSLDATVLGGARRTPVADATVVRAPASPAAGGAGTDGPSPQPARRSPAAAVKALIGVAAAAVIVVGVVVGVGLAGGQTDASAEAPEATDPGGEVLSFGAPVPELASAERSADGRELVVTWSNPDPVDGDTYAWQRTDAGASETRSVTEATEVTIGSLEAGTTVCLDIWVVRNGVLSAEPLSVCDPS